MHDPCNIRGGEGEAILVARGRRNDSHCPRARSSRMDEFRKSIVKGRRRLGLRPQSSFPNVATNKSRRSSELLLLRAAFGADFLVNIGLGEMFRNPSRMHQLITATFPNCASDNKVFLPSDKREPFRLPAKLEYLYENSIFARGSFRRTVYVYVMVSDPLV